MMIRNGHCFFGTCIHRLHLALCYSGNWLMLPVPLLERLMSLLFCLFLFRMTLTDALTGFLPRN
jgi:hypothetical protein